MITKDVANFLVNNTDLVKGDSIWLHTVPENHSEGVTIKKMSLLASYYDYAISDINIIVTYRSSTNLESRIGEILNLLNQRRGILTVPWSVVDNIHVNDYGRDSFDRLVSTITATVKHNIGE
jgi:hypothetical protein